MPWVAYDEFQFCCPAGGQDLSHIRVERWDGSSWVAVGAGSISGANTNGNAVALSVVGGIPTLACDSARRQEGRARFKRTTIKVAAACGGRFVPKLSAAAKKSYRRDHKLAIRVGMTFLPAGGGATRTRTIRTTLRPTPKRRRRCPARLPKRLKKTLRCRPK